jgi:hypothetical protein
MTISRILNDDIFTYPKIDWEDRKIIVCGTNDMWDNRWAPESVAGIIWSNYSPDFRKFPEWAKNIWDIYAREEISDTYIAIVCNSVNGILESSRDWRKLSEALATWYQSIFENYARANILDMNKIANNLTQAVSGLHGTEDDFKKSIDELLKISHQALNEILHPVRSVLIWWWKSWIENNASIVNSLSAMEKSPLNLHLYLREKSEAQHVAQVIEMYPWVFQNESIDEDIRRYA